jgi:hypothetical protein
VDFHLHDEEESRKHDSPLRQAYPKNEQRLWELPPGTVLQKQIKGTIPKRATYRKQEQQAQRNKNDRNDFAVQE